MNSNGHNGGNGPLKGIRVLDMTMWQFGPVSAAMMGDMGADVIKIESLDGDAGRGLWRASTLNMDLGEGRNAYFEACNRNKRGIAVNLKTEEGRQIIYKAGQEHRRVRAEPPPGRRRAAGRGIRYLKRDKPHAGVRLRQRLRARRAGLASALVRRLRSGARRAYDVRHAAGARNTPRAYRKAYPTRWARLCSAWASCPRWYAATSRASGRR